tara:strand:- start:637 stop:780 length:144 start_codon:yes stop_codon:yes gene_type:complete
MVRIQRLQRLDQPFALRIFSQLFGVWKTIDPGFILRATIAVAARQMQ